MKIVQEKDVRKCFHKRRPDSHKGDNGKVLVVGGSNDLVGAPALAALAALSCYRTGVDLVTVIAPEKAGFIINRYSPDLIVRKVKGSSFSETDAKNVLDLSKKADCVLIGPGIGQDKKTANFVKKVVSKCGKPMILDADAIKAMKGKKFSGKVLITPHAVEFQIFSGKNPHKNREKIVKQTAKKHDCVILLKGKIDAISDGRKVKLNKTGNAGMTVGGTGDVLAGICAALVAQKNSLFDSACAAAFINGAVGDILLRKKGHGFTASDFLSEIPEVLKKYWK